MSALYCLQNVRQSYDGRTVLAIDDLELPENGIIGFFGPNGSGKSTLFSLLSLVSRPCSGKILFRGLDTERLQPEQRRCITILPQEPYLLKRTVFDNVAYGLKIRDIRDGLEKKVHEALSWVGLPASFAGRKWYQLSGGEVQRVALAGRLILRPEVLILDEPTASVDIGSAQRIREAVFLARKQWQTTLLIASHDQGWLDQVSNYRVGLFQGRVVNHGAVNFLFGPWQEKGADQMVKKFPDGQVLVLPGPADKNRNVSVAMLDPAKISICCSGMDSPAGTIRLSGMVSTVRRQRYREELLVDVMVSGFLFQVCLPAHDVKTHQLWPGTAVMLDFSQDGVRWL
ncbi:energy-coupling factor ABC transporter ATP-binding protein [Desulfolithobacter sp.]